jgi:hypothetical protein
MWEVAPESAFQLKLALIWSGDAEDMWCCDEQLAGKKALFALVRVGVKASAKTLSSYFVIFAYIAYNLAQS